MPWAHEKPDINLVTTVQKHPVKACKALEIGCGTGTDAVWLAGQGFRITALDVSEIAIGLARQQAKQAGVRCRFHVADFLNDKIDGAPFRFIFDRGFFHTFDKLFQRKAFAEKVASVLSDGGLWLSLIGSADDPPRKRGEGPPQRSALDIVKATEHRFEILSLSTSLFGSDQPQPARNWVCLMRKR